MPHDLEKRMTRMESRLVQLMIHLGLDPYERTYDTYHQHGCNAGTNTQSYAASKGSKRQCAAFTYR